MPGSLPQVVKWSLVVLGGAVAVRHAIRGYRRRRAMGSGSEGLPRKRSNAQFRHFYPTLRRDPATGEYRLH